MYKRQVITDLVNEVVKLRFQRAGEALASHLSEACRERFIAANQAVTGTDYGLARLGKLESCTILTINDNTVLAQINASYGDTPAAYTLVLTPVSYTHLIGKYENRFLSLSNSVNLQD